jgi:tRNA(Ile)-lysidine synthase
MLNKLTTFIRSYDLILPGDRVVCAVSGGADSVALLFGLYLLQEKLQFTLAAAHFNHQLRGAESDRDEAFVRMLCDRYDIPLSVGAAPVKAGRKGLEAAAREARYAFFDTLPGKIATAHTANDNAETVLLHLVRGTGLNGLGGIAPISGRIIRPMLSITRQEVLAFLQEYSLQFVTDSSNDTDAFLRNRLRHHVMPLLEQENPRLAENLSAMALSVREDARTLSQLAAAEKTAQPDVEHLRQMPVALRSRALETFLKESGVREPERSHIALLESLVFSDKPSARANFPGNVTIERCYGTLRVLRDDPRPEPVQVNCPGVTLLPQWGLRLVCTEAETVQTGEDCFTVIPKGKVMVRSRQAGDAIRLPGGTKSLKKLFIDRKIPASRRPYIPIVEDAYGILGVLGFGADLDREGAAFCFRFEKVDGEELLPHE